MNDDPTPGADGPADPLIPRSALRSAALTTVLALVPVLTSTGRGSDVMVPMAIPSFGGMLVATIVGIFWIPVLYVFVMKVFSRKPQPAAASTSPPPAGATAEA